MYKNLITLAVAMTIVISATFARNEKNINSAICKVLRVPSSLLESKFYEKVNIKFKITEEGKAMVLNVESASPELKKYIITQFPKINFSGTSKNSNEIYVIDINFKVL